MLLASATFLPSFMDHSQQIKDEFTVNNQHWWWWWWLSTGDWSGKGNFMVSVFTYRLFTDGRLRPLCHWASFRRKKMKKSLAISQKKIQNFFVYFLLKLNFVNLFRIFVTGSVKRRKSRDKDYFTFKTCVLINVYISSV